MYYWIDGPSIIESDTPDDFYTTEYQIEKLHGIRTLTGLNRSQFAKKYHIPLRTLEEWEAGRRKISPYFLRMLSYYIRFSLANTDSGTVTGSDIIQWHPAFCAALRLDFWEYRDSLIFEEEYQLSHKPLSIDCLVIKKTDDTVIENDIGRIFKSINIFEYKSPDDTMNIDTYYKTVAYACLYISQPGQTADVSPSEITITLVRSRKPSKLLTTLSGNGFTVTQNAPGIYYITGPIMFTTQVIVSSELNEQNHIALKALTNRISKTLYMHYTAYLKQKKGSSYKLADMVMQPISQSNSKKINSWRQDNNMCQALREIMADEIDQIVQEAVQKAVQEAVQKTRNEILQNSQQVEAEYKENAQKKEAGNIITLCKELKLSKTETIRRLQSMTGITNAKAKDYYSIFA